MYKLVSVTQNSVGDSCVIEQRLKEIVQSKLYSNTPLSQSDHSQNEEIRGLVLQLKEGDERNVAYDHIIDLCLQETFPEAHLKNILRIHTVIQAFEPTGYLFNHPRLEELSKDVKTNVQMVVTALKNLGLGSTGLDALKFVFSIPSIPCGYNDYDKLSSYVGYAMDKSWSVSSEKCEILDYWSEICKMATVFSEKEKAFNNTRVMANFEDAMERSLNKVLRPRGSGPGYDRFYLVNKDKLNEIIKTFPMQISGRLTRRRGIVFSEIKQKINIFENRVKKHVTMLSRTKPERDAWNKLHDKKKTEIIADLMCLAYLNPKSKIDNGDLVTNLLDRLLKYVGTDEHSLSEIRSGAFEQISLVSGHFSTEDHLDRILRLSHSFSKLSKYGFLFEFNQDVKEMVQLNIEEVCTRLKAQGRESSKTNALSVIFSMPSKMRNEKPISCFERGINDVWKRYNKSEACPLFDYWSVILQAIEPLKESQKEAFFKHIDPLFSTVLTSNSPREHSIYKSFKDKINSCLEKEATLQDTVAEQRVRTLLIDSQVSSVLQTALPNYGQVDVSTAIKLVELELLLPSLCASGMLPTDLITRDLNKEVIEAGTVAALNIVSPNDIVEGFVWLSVRFRKVTPLLSSPKLHSLNEYIKDKFDESANLKVNGKTLEAKGVLSLVFRTMHNVWDSNDILGEIIHHINPDKSTKKSIFLGHWPNIMKVVTTLDKDSQRNILSRLKRSLFSIIDNVKQGPTGSINRASFRNYIAFCDNNREALCKIAPFIDKSNIDNDLKHVTLWLTLNNTIALFNNRDISVNDTVEEVGNQLHVLFERVIERDVVLSDKKTREIYMYVLDQLLSHTKTLEPHEQVSVFIRLSKPLSQLNPKGLFLFRQCGDRDLDHKLKVLDTYIVDHFDKVVNQINTTDNPTTSLDVFNQLIYVEPKAVETVFSRLGRAFGEWAVFEMKDACFEYKSSSIKRYFEKFLNLISEFSSNDTAEFFNELKRGFDCSIYRYAFGPNKNQINKLVPMIIQFPDAEQLGFWATYVKQELEVKNSPRGVFKLNRARWNEEPAETLIEELNMQLTNIFQNSKTDDGLPVNLIICFEGEEGIDVGGLTNEFLSMAYSVILKNNKSETVMNVLGMVLAISLVKEFPIDRTLFEKFNIDVSDLFWDVVDTETKQSALKYVINGESETRGDSVLVPPGISISRGSKKSSQDTRRLTGNMVERLEDVGVDSREASFQTIEGALEKSLRSDDDLMMTFKSGFYLVAKYYLNAISKTFEEKNSRKASVSNEALVKSLFTLQSLDISRTTFSIADESTQESTIKQKQMIYNCNRFLSEHKQDTAILENFYKFCLGVVHADVTLSINLLKAEENESRLPTAHTCFRGIDIPDYDSYEIFESKMKTAITESGSFEFA